MNEFGTNYRINIFGESHNKFIGVCIDGCPAGIHLLQEDFIDDIEKRKCFYIGRTRRKETDIPNIVSGVFNQKTTGMPITILFENKDIIESDYSNFQRYPRPSHSDFVAYKKFNGFNDYRGSGAFSGRMTLALVAAGVIAKKIISPICIQSHLVEVHNSSNIEQELMKATQLGDSVGGIIECKVSLVPIGLGEPFFDSIESKLSHIIFSIPGIKGIEFGAGFGITKMYGSEANDEFINIKGHTKTNYAGGINAGITNGNDIIFRVAVRPTPSIFKTQQTIDLQTGSQVELNIKGRHDVCFAVRVPVIIEACTAIVLADLLLK